MIELAEKLPLLAETPVKIIWGLKDPCFHREMLKKISRHFPRANIVELSNASHLVLEDNPEAVVAEIEHFLREPLPKAPIKHLTKPKLSTTVSPAIIEKFRSYAVSNKKQTAVVEPVFITDKVSYSTTTYYQMFQLLNQYERGLQELGLKPKDKVLMLVSPGKEFLLLSYAVIARGAIPVFLDPGMGKEKLFKVIKEINPDAFIGSVLAHILRFKKKTLMPNLKFSVVSSEIPLPGSTGVGFFKKFAVQPLPIVPPSNPVLIAFTSGATGTPKGVPFTDSMIKEILRILAKDFGLTSKAFDMPFLPIFSLFTLALGIGSVFPPVNPSKPLSVSAEKVLRLLNDYEITYSFGSPTIWNKIAEYCLRTRVKIDSMRKVFIAGAPVSENVLSRVKDCLESGEVFTPYGATEALPVTLCSADYIKKKKKAVSLSNDRGVFVGKPLSSIKVKIINWQEKGGKIRELEPLAIGEIAVSGENISKEYFNNPEATKLSKFQLEGKTWHKMGDLGYLDREGNLYFCGRKVHTVVFKDKILYSVCVENIFNSHSWVARSALVNLGENGAGIVIEPKPQYMPKTEEEKRIFSLKLREIADSAGLTKWIKNFFFHPSFPVDPRHNAKIDRIALSSWAQNKLKEATVRERETQIANI
ncbi:MAG: hypothetical protein D6780_00730 [Candidatus Dadabacteria bacterium]|nr:MAG: hypothetical protein D6780_00730 [Candidatus Dadabacteria bacterium]